MPQSVPAPVAVESKALAKSYIPSDHEAGVSQRWVDARAFHAEPGTGRAPYCVMIPPPNVTAALHLGHALNNTLQDVLVRIHRMKGFETLWMPGTDHAGIATQSVVEKRLLQQGQRRTDFTRDAFISKVQEWKDEYEAVILSQLKVMGASCDFDRTRFTMDPVCARAVREAFFRLFSDGLIERGKRLVNWDPVSQTALADDEVEMEEVDGHFWYLRYPLEDGTGHVTVATTRPETMLGDTAVAMNPRDPRAAALRGKRVRLPIVGRIIPIIEDDAVVLSVDMGGDPADPKSAMSSGFLKVTPAHDQNDWEIGLRHKLPAINVMGPDGSISDHHGWTDLSEEARSLVGLTRELAREKIVAWFRDHGLLEQAKPYRHAVGHSYRSHVPVEPYLSDQWYVRVTDDRLRGSALRAMAADQRTSTSSSSESNQPVALGDGELRFFPARYAKTFQLWHEGIRDWCISRQLWWGHRIPVWSKRITPSHATWSEEFAAQQLTSLKDGIVIRIVRVDDGKSVDPKSAISTTKEYDLFACLHSDDLAPSIEALGFGQDPDVLDTWFSSALWPLSTLGWPDDRAAGMAGMVEAFNPTSVLSTAREIITLWVSRMVMFNRYLNHGKLPFREVFIHSVVQDGFGQKMSKSLGNGVDPRDIIHTHGTDAMRFVMVQMSTTTQDVRLPVDVLCPFSGEAFTPKTIVTPAGYTVAAPIQQSPKNPAARMVSAYGAASGEATATPEMPLARNTSARFDIGRNFSNKLWNATRFALSSVTSDALAVPLDMKPTCIADRWILSRLEATAQRIESSTAQYSFNEYAEAMYDFVWRDFCDWYLEAIKPTVKSDPMQQRVLLTVLNATMRLVHPVMPFVTEALWPAVQQAGRAGVAGIILPPSELLCQAAWPTPCGVHNAEVESIVERVQSLVLAIRNLRGELRVEPKRRITMIPSTNTAALIVSGQGMVEALAGIGELSAPLTARPAGSIVFAFEGDEQALANLLDSVDKGSERTRLAGVIADRERAIKGYRSKLDNAGYLAKAPANVVEETRTMCLRAEADLEAARRAFESVEL
ncbi:MAG: valine--tRNA ligase [Planctomycetota bacterium]|nr:valine--tRNA ligase [Planctomycetota bacterium]